MCSYTINCQKSFHISQPKQIQFKINDILNKEIVQFKIFVREKKRDVTIILKI